MPLRAHYKRGAPALGCAAMDGGINVLPSAKFTIQYNTITISNDKMKISCLNKAIQCCPVGFLHEQDGEKNRKSKFFA